MLCDSISSLEEVTLQDMKDGVASNMAGWSKITGSCAQSVLDSWEYVWIDTCCIDKTSSAELSEAINSMFRWYELAEACYAYLSDVKSAAEDPCRDGSDFRSSQWFRRGWTLQELLAPYHIDFVDQNWDWIGSKATLDDVVKEVTMVSDLMNYKSASVAQKMSWASGRITTRIEDMAYCLLGIFDVHMPPLYGERENAFFRLQLEIINKTDDESILAWDGYSRLGLLAASPEDFKSSSTRVKSVWGPLRPTHSITNKGFSLHLPLIAINSADSKRMGNHQLKYFAPLNCIINDRNGEGRVVCLTLYQNEKSGKWSRDGDLAFIDRPSTNYGPAERTLICVPLMPTWTPGYSSSSVHKIIQMSVNSLSAIGFEPKSPLVRETGACWHVSNVSGRPLLYLMYMDLDSNKSRASITLENKDHQRLGIVLGVIHDRYWIDIVVLEEDESMEQILDPSFKLQRLLLGRDRVSRPFLHGSLNVRLKHSSTPWYTTAEIVFDSEGRIRWPIRQRW